MNENIQEIADSIVVNSFDFSLKNKTWQNLGYSKCPKYGEWINKFFRKKWKVNLENEILVSLIKISTSALIRYSYPELKEKKALISTISKMVSENDLWETLDFNSERECYDSFNEALPSYLEEPTDDWHKKFLKSIPLKSIPDKKLRGKISMGAIQLGQAISYQAHHQK
tara:strand:- start:1987 stop:2493 length:507 start_codon:yes stop_codon:yes gene_type:complete